MPLQLTVRKVNFEFPSEIERCWFGNSLCKTHLLNSLTLLLPDIERYLIVHVSQRMKLLDNPHLLQQAKAFIGQEGQHASQHTKFWHHLRSFGYEIDTYLRWLKAILFKILSSRLSNELNLAIGAGLEHLTTLFATFALEEEYLKEAEPHLKNLFEWHAVEEIEHKSVVFDVFQDTTSSYPVRIMGMIISHLLILGFLNLGWVVFLYRDKKLLNRTVWQDMIQFWFIQEKMLWRVLFNSLKYCRQNFHPSQIENPQGFEKVSFPGR